MIARQLAADVAERVGLEVARRVYSAITSGTPATLRWAAQVWPDVGLDDAIAAAVAVRDARKRSHP